MFTRTAILLLSTAISAVWPIAVAANDEPSLDLEVVRSSARVGDRVEVVVAAEEKFGVKIPDDDVKDLTTVGDAVSYIKGALA